MTEADFAEAQIAHRLGALGSCRLSLSDAAREHAVSVSSGSALAWNAALGQPYAVNGWQGRRGKPARLAWPYAGTATASLHQRP